MQSLLSQPSQPTTAIRMISDLKDLPILGKTNIRSATNASLFLCCHVLSQQCQDLASQTNKQNIYGTVCTKVLMVPLKSFQFQYY
jgi:hypothetical protein